MYGSRTHSGCQGAVEHRVGSDTCHRGAPFGRAACSRQVQLNATLGSPDRGICFMYLAEPSHIEKNLKPYHWYQELVLLGATYLNFPETYVRSIEAIESMDDQDEARRTRHDQLIEEILNFSPCGSEPSYD